MAVTIAAVLFALAAAGAVSAFLSTRRTLSGERREREAERGAAEEALARLESELATLRGEISGAAERAAGDAKKIAELEGLVAELSKGAERARREETTQRQFFARKARDTFELLRQRLAADGFPERLEELGNGRAHPLSDDAKRLEKEIESWMERGGSEDPAILAVLGVLDFARGDAKRAELRLRAAGRTSSEPLLWENLGDLSRLTGRGKRAVEAYRNAAKAAPEDSPVHRKLGLALFSARDYAAAVKPLAVAMNRHPDDLDLRLKTIRALVEAGDYQRAVELAKDGAKRFPKAAELPSLAMVAFSRMKRFGDAQAQYDKAMDIDPNFPAAHVARGMAYIEEGKPAEASVSFRKALEADPDSAEAHYGLGVAAHRAQAYEESLASLKRAVELKPDYAEAWYAMKATYEALKKFEAAVEALNKAVALNPHLTA